MAIVVPTGPHVQILPGGLGGVGGIVQVDELSAVLEIPQQLTASLTAAPSLTASLTEPQTLTARLTAAPSLTAGLLATQPLTASLACEGKSMADITLTVGEDITIEVTLRSGPLTTDAPVNVTGGTFTFRARDLVGDTTFDLSKSTGTPGEFDIVDGPNGRADLVLLDTDTATQEPRDDYDFDIWFEDSSGNRNQVAKGRLILERRIVEL